MNRTEFMRQLEGLLQDISDEERAEALDYYNSYFEDAGPENEAQVIRELGSPGKVAAIIKADLREGNEAYGEYTEHGYEDSRVREDSQVPDQYAKTGRAGRGYRTGGRKNTSTIILLVILAVFAAPIVLGVGGGILIGILGGILGIVGGIFGGLFGSFVGGVALIVSGIVQCFKVPSLGLVSIGIGGLGLALGLLFLVLAVLLVGKAIPWIIRKISDLVQRTVHKADRQDKGGAQS